MFESQNLLDMQSVLSSTAILVDPMDQHRDFWDWRIHPVQQSQFEGHRNLRQALCPIGLDLAVLDLFRASDDFRQPLALNGRRDPVVIDSHSLSLAHSFVLSLIEGLSKGDTHHLTEVANASGDLALTSSNQSTNTPAFGFRIVLVD